MRATIHRGMVAALLLLQAGCSDDNGSPDTGPPAEAGPDGSPACTHPAVKVDCTDGWCTVPAGCYTMGSPATEKCRETCWTVDCALETRHSVTLTRGFVIKATEVTQAEFEGLMGYNPSYYKSGAKAPVEMISWHEAVAACNALSQQAGLTPCYDCALPAADAGPTTDSTPLDAGGPPAPDGGMAYWRSVRCDTAAAFADGKIYDCPGYRLPTEAEWEYAHRAGTDTAYHNGPITSCTGSDPGLDAIAWYRGNSSKVTHEVGSKQPNGWGLYDMAGNVWEWCHDRYQRVVGADPVTDPWGPKKGEARVDRGGSCWSEPQFLRAAMRDLNFPDQRFDYIGLRPIRGTSL